MNLKYIIEICIGIDIAIIGIAYPIIIDKISNIGNRYDSNYLSEVFEQEFPQRAYGRILPFRSRKITTFEWLLFFTIASFAFLIAGAEPLFWKNSIWMQNSAKLLTLTLTFFLVISFIIWLDKIALYNGKPARLLKYLIAKYQSISKESRYKENLINSLNEIAYFAVEKEDIHLQEELSKFYTEEFIKIRHNHNSSEALEYPFYFYDVTRKLIKKLLRKEVSELDRLTSPAVSNWWLLGQDFQEIPISEKTYDSMWGNIYQISDNAKFIKEHWSTAHQYYRFQLGRKTGKYNIDIRDYENKEEIEIRESEQIRFLEFHYALGGLLLYRQNNNGLKRILNFTQSQPPDYYLLPNSMYDIFYWFAYFKEGYVNRVTPTDFKYPFPDIDNLGLSRQITFWICQYVCLLFIRQFFLQPYYTFHQFTEQPRLPNKVLELLKWKDALDYFKFCLNKILENKDLLDLLGYNLSDAILEDIEGFEPELRIRIEEQIQQNRTNAPLSDNKISQFLASSATMIDDAFNQYRLIINKDDFANDEPVMRFGLNGGSILFRKEGFTEGDIPHLNYDSIFAQQIIYDQINRYIPNSFLGARTRRYLIDRENFEDAFKRLKYDKEKHLIVGFGFFDNGLVEIPDFFEDMIRLTSPVFSNVLFVLPKTDLPRINHPDLKADEIKELRLEPIIPDRNVYASVIDLNLDENSELRQRWNTNENQNPAESVQLTIAFIAEIIWRQNRDVVQLNITSPLREQGIKNDLSDIVPFKTIEND